jgi:hypothetical protein
MKTGKVLQSTNRSELLAPSSTDTSVDKAVSKSNSTGKDISKKTPMTQTVSNVTAANGLLDDSTVEAETDTSPSSNTRDCNQAENEPTNGRMSQPIKREPSNETSRNDTVATSTQLAVSTSVISDQNQSSNTSQSADPTCQTLKLQQPPTPSNPITIHLLLISSPTTPKTSLSISPDCTARELRTLAAEATSVPLVDARLIYRGKFIADCTKSVEEYGVQEGSVVDLVGEPRETAGMVGGDATSAKLRQPTAPSNPITIHLLLTSSPATPKTSLSISPDCTARELRTLAAEATSVPLADARLIYRGQFIADCSKSVQEYGVEEGSVVHLVGKPRDAAGMVGGDAIRVILSHRKN